MKSAGSDISILDLFTIGIGPSSSHTVGPMRAAHRFLGSLQESRAMNRISRIEVRLYASLALTGKGHGTDVAVLLGLEGEAPETIDVDSLANRVARIRESRSLKLNHATQIAFDEQTDLVFLRKESLPAHPNGLRFIAYDSDGSRILEKTYYSIGGGFVVDDADAIEDRLTNQTVQRLYPYRSGNDLLKLASESGLSVSEMTLRNESCWRTEGETRFALRKVWEAMQSCVRRGCQQEGILPGGLKLERRAAQLFGKLQDQSALAPGDPLAALDWVSMWAIAVNEENAAGGASSPLQPTVRPASSPPSFTTW